MSFAPQYQSSHGVQWETLPGFVPYQTAVDNMKLRVHDILHNNAPELVQLLQHPPLFTKGAASSPNDLLNPRAPVHPSQRGGRVTFHGPGQRVAYLMLDLRTRNRDVRLFIQNLQTWIIQSLLALNIPNPHTRPDDGVGVWAGSPPAKIAFIGVRLSRWISSHGISVNLNPDLSHFHDIIPCGLQDLRVASIHQFNPHVSMNDLDNALKTSFSQVF